MTGLSFSPPNSYIIPFRVDPTQEPDIAQSSHQQPAPPRQDGGISTVPNNPSETQCLAHCYPDFHEPRLNNLFAVLRWVSRLGIEEVIVVEQDRIPRLPSALLPSGCKHVFAFNDGPFNKSWALNIGFRESSGSVVAFGDADIILDAANLLESFALCHAGVDAVSPYDRLIELTSEQTDAFLRSGAGLPTAASQQKSRREVLGEYLCFCGGLFLIRRNVYEEIGGFDERFLGWGGEDDAMSLKLARLVPNTKTVIGQAAYHLFHERPRTLLDGHSHYGDNVALLNKYHSVSKGILQMSCASQRKTMGNREKYGKFKKS